MTPEEAKIIILILKLIVAMLFSSIGIMMWWLTKNKFEISIMLIDEGSYYIRTFRCREVNGRYYTIKDIRKKNPIYNITKKQINDCIIPTEGIPFIGINKYVLMEKIGEAYIPRKPIQNIPDHGITDTMISWLSTSKKELFEATKPQLTTSEFMKEIVMPMTLVLLAVMCLILFPKIYTEIQQSVGNAVPAVSGKIAEKLTNFIPLG